MQREGGTEQAFGIGKNAEFIKTGASAENPRRRNERVKGKPVAPVLSSGFRQGERRAAKEN
jgi:hypothetical protein